MKNIDFKALIPHAINVGILWILALVFFYPQLQGKKLNQGDINQYRAMVNESIQYQKETGEEVFWIGSMFGGMPTIGFSIPQPTNVATYFYKTLSLFFRADLGIFIFGLISFYIAMIAMGVNKWLSLIGAATFVFSTGYLGLIEAGHTSKTIVTFACSPVIAGFMLIFRRKYLLGGLLFTTFLAIALRYNHPQMLYYLAMCMSIPTIIYLIQYLKNKETTHLLKAYGILALGCIISLGTSAGLLLPTLEYSKSSMRGAPILKKEANAQASSSNTDGLEWNYAMSWSNGSKDLLSSFIPYAVGGGSGVVLDDDAFVVKKAPQLRNQPLPLYWGALPSTSMPYYFGALMFFLFILGAIVIRGPTKWWMVASVVLTMLLSLGINFESFNRFLFDTLPLLNKFRTPNSVLTVTNLFIPFLGILGLQKIISDKNKSQYLKPVLYAGGALGGICLILALMGGSFFSFESQVDSQLGQMAPWMQQTRADYLVSSSFRSFFLIAIGVALIYLHIKGKIKLPYLLIGLGFVSIIDVVQVGKTYVSPDDFVPQRQVDVPFSPRPVDQQIMQDPDPNFRVFDLTVALDRSATASYFIKTIGGYSPVKLQRYQDLMDGYISRNHQPVLNMLNTKYYITMETQGGPLVVRQNPGALGHAWFVRNVQMVNSPNEEYDALQSLEPTTTAIINNEFSDIISGKSFSGSGQISLTEYAPGKLSYQSNSSEEQLAVFSEMWYSPGWKVTIDGQEAEMIRANYALRGLVIPAGDHSIQFEFKPSSVTTGRWISLVSSILILLGFAYLIWYRWSKGEWPSI